MKIVYYGILFCEIFDVTKQFMIFQQLFIRITFVACVYSTKTDVASTFDKPTTVSKRETN